MLSWQRWFFLTSSCTSCKLHPLLELRGTCKARSVLHSSKIIEIWYEISYWNKTCAGLGFAGYGSAAPYRLLQCFEVKAVSTLKLKASQSSLVSKGIRRSLHDLVSVPSHKADVPSLPHTDQTSASWERPISFRVCGWSSKTAGATSATTSVTCPDKDPGKQWCLIPLSLVRTAN